MGTIKCQVAKKVKMQQVIVKDALCFYWAIQKISSATQICFVTIKDIEESYSAELKGIFENADSISGCSNIHCKKFHDHLSSSTASFF